MKFCVTIEKFIEGKAYESDGQISLDDLTKDELDQLLLIIGKRSCFYITINKFLYSELQQEE